MPNPKNITGNIFASKAQTLVNTINCVGAMGAGIALEYRLRYPKMYERYTNLCNRKMIKIGSLWLWKAEDRWILNFPTKLHWRDPSKEEYLHAGLKKFMDTYAEKGVESIAFPLLGAQNGGIDGEVSQSIMESYLSKCDIPAEIYHFEPTASDDQFELFRMRLLGMSPAQIKSETKLKSTAIQSILNALKDSSICHLSRLAALSGVGRQSVERVFQLVYKSSSGKEKLYQAPLSLGIDSGRPIMAVQESNENHLICDKPELTPNSLEFRSL